MSTRQHCTRHDCEAGVVSADGSVSIEDYLPIPAPLSPITADGVTIEQSSIDGARSLTVRNASGFHLEIRFSAREPEIVIKGASLHVQAEGELRLSGKRVHLDASERLSLSAPSIATKAAIRSTHIEGIDRLEAGTIETQASAGTIALKAEAGISLDGESIGLNNDPCPSPFGWSERAKEMRK